MGYGPKHQRPDVTERFVCPPERSISVPLEELLADFKGRVSADFPSPQLRSWLVSRNSPLKQAVTSMLHTGRLSQDQRDDFDYITQMMEALAQLNYVTLGRLA